MTLELTALAAMTTVRKARDGGWRAETNINLPELGEGRMAKVSTWKGSRGGVETNVQVCKDDGMGAFSFILFQDFSKTVYTAPGKATEANVKKAHMDALSQFETVKGEIVKFYAGKQL